MGKHKEKKSKKNKREKKAKKKRYSSSSSSSENEWVEKSQNKASGEEEISKRDDWMSMSSSFLTTSNSDRKEDREKRKREEREKDVYDPKSNVRELNPYWKDGGDGLPTFKKPSEHDFEYKSKYTGSSGWRKKELVEKHKDEAKNIFTSEDNEEKIGITDKELNAIAAKLVKAEIMGNEELVKELKLKLENARSLKTTTITKEENVLLTTTDNQGYSRPIKLKSEYGESSGTQRKKKQRVETHKDGERIKYFPDDDKYSLQQMFENEKYSTVQDQNKEFINMASKIKNQDMDEIFEDKIRQKDNLSDKKTIDKAIQQHQMTSKTLENCLWCIQSDNMPKHLMISMGETMFLMLPPFQPITKGHCFIIPIRHVPCSTQLDENEWSELLDFRKSLTKMFLESDEDVIFFETAVFLHKFPHMIFECVPVPKEQGDLAPIYFKKAIDESETEWSVNKKLVSLANRDVRRAIPKGLPYFCVSFGMNEGYAHVIEEEKYFPKNFAQEIIGGMLDLDHAKWRKPKKQGFNEQSERVKEFTKIWCNYDCTKS
ncbi:CWF19-like protein 2 homolog [Onthophagus taurus]|uniref:CWF19-like protein 2 homolog n=1 Tax=Onthophagus taurus TaxID=166361 RepID=UPI000C20410B|nr:CWF19-like protein 2 homolog [Onthophagus taurus]